MRHMIFAAALLIGTAGVAHANLVVNGGFETGDFTGWDQVNDTSFSGVSETFGGVAPPEGAFQAFFGPTDPGGGGILQDIATTPGQSYDLTFLLANLGNPPNAFGLFWDGGFVDLDFDLDPFEYTPFEVSLTASGALTSLGFIFFHEPSFFLLDDIVLLEGGGGPPPVPAPAALALFGLGAIGIAAARRGVR